MLCIASGWRGRSGSRYRTEVRRPDVVYRVAAASGYALTMFEHLDYVYMPSADVASDLAYFEDVLGGRVIFAIEGMDTRVAMVELTPDPPRILLAGHLEGDVPILVYRVDDLGVTTAQLEARGWTAGHTLEIPQGPVLSFTAPGGQRLAVYALSRPGAEAGFEGRRDF